MPVIHTVTLTYHSARKKSRYKTDAGIEDARRFANEWAAMLHVKEALIRGPGVRELVTVPEDDKLTATLARCCEEFRNEITTLAEGAGLTVLDTYRLWRRYEAACHDQSCLISEFKQWFWRDLKLPDPNARRPLETT